VKDSPSWRGADDVLAPNEVLCPVCKVVIRSSRELRPGDRVYCAVHVAVGRGARSAGDALTVLGGVQNVVTAE
jgi:hypothetical protein